MMQQVVSVFDPCSYTVVAVALQVTALRVGAASHRLAAGMVWAGIVALLLVGGLGFAEVRPSTPIEVIAVAVIAWIWGSSAALSASVILPVAWWLRNGWAEAVRERAESERKRLEAEREREEESRHEKAAAQFVATPKPEPPSADELLAQRRIEYERKVGRVDSLPGVSEEEKRDMKTKLERDFLRSVEQYL
jgi:hypothetical protein